MMTTLKKQMTKEKLNRLSLQRLRSMLKKFDSVEKLTKTESKYRSLVFIVWAEKNLSKQLQFPEYVGLFDHDSSLFKVDPIPKDRFKTNSGKKKN